MRCVWISVVVACVAASSCGGSRGTDYQGQAEALLAKKDYAGAIVVLRNAVQADPKGGAVRLLLAQAYEKSGQLSPAKAEYVRAADLMPSDVQAQLGAARILLRAGDHEDARTRAQGALKLDAKNAEAFLIQGRAAAGMDDLEDASKAFDEGLSLDATRTDLLLNRARLRVVQGNDAEAEASFKQAIVVAPDSVQARLALADFYWYRQRLPAAEQALKEAVKLNDKEGRAARTLASFYMSTNRPAEAEAPLKLAASANDNPQLKLMLADYYGATGRANLAVTILEALAAQPLTYSAATLRLATLEFSKPDHGKAHQLLDELIGKEPLNAVAQVQKAQFLAAENRQKEALAIAQAVIKTNPDVAPAHELLGSLYLQVHELQLAESALKESIRLDNRAVGSMILLATVDLALGRANEAVELAESAVQTQPANDEARLILARALAAAGQFDRAKTEVAKLSPDSAQVQNVIGDIELKRGNRTAAQLAFERASTLDARSTEALRGLVRLDAGDKRIADAVRRVDRFLAKNAGDAQVLFLAAQTHAAANDLPAAERIARQALDKDPNMRPVYDLLGSIYRQQNKLEEAQRVFEKVTVERPGDVPAHTMVGILQLVRGDQAGARSRFEKVLSIDPRAAVASNNLAYMDAEAGTNLDVALNRAQTAKAALPEDPEVNDTLGWVYVKRGLPALGVPPIEQAIQKDGGNPTYHYHLGMAHAKAGDRDRARVSLQRALQISKAFEGAAAAQRTLDSF